MTPDPAHPRPDASLTRRSVGAGLWALGGTVAKTVLRILVLGVLARLVEPDEFGLMVAALIVLELLRILVRVGIGPVVVQRPHLEERHERTAFLVSLGVGLGLCACMYLAAPFLAGTVFRSPSLEAVMRAVCLSLPLYGSAVVPQALLQRELRFGTIVKIETAAYTLGYVPVAITLASLDGGVWALVFATLAEAAIVAGLSFAARPVSPALRTDLRTLRELTLSGTGFLGVGIANYFARGGDKWVVGRWLGAANLGFYKYAYELATLPGVLVGEVLNRVLFPVMSRVQSDPARLARAYRGTLTLVATLVLPVSVAMALLADELILVALGPKWIVVVEPFRILSVGAVLRSGLKVSDSLIQAKGAVYQHAWRYSVYAGAVILGGWVGQRGGVEGAAAGVLVATVGGFGLMLNLCIRLTTVTGSDLLRIFLRAVPVTAITGAAVLLGARIAQEWALPPIGVLLAAGTAAAVLLSASLALFPRRILGEEAASLLQTLARSAIDQVPPLRLVARRLGEAPARSPRATSSSVSEEPSPEADMPSVPSGVTRGSQRMGKIRTLLDYADTGIRLGEDLHSKWVLATMLPQLRWRQARNETEDRRYSVGIRMSDRERHPLYLRGQDIFTVREVLDGTPYIRDGMRLNPPRVIVDLGAHIGLATIAFKAEFPAARIHCYEPDPGSFALLEANTHGLSGITLHPEAVGSEAKTATLYVNENCHTSTSLVADAGVGGVQEIQCTVRTLDEILEDAGGQVDLIKLDVEGYELEALSGSERCHGVRWIVSEIDGSPQRIEEFVSLFPGHDAEIVPVTSTMFLVYLERREPTSGGSDPLPADEGVLQTSEAEDR